MIVKTKVGKTFGGTVGYTLDKGVDDKDEKAEIIGGQGLDYDFITKDFNYVRKLNPKVEKAVWFASFSFAPGEEVSNELMMEIADDYVKEFGFEQYLVVRHHDTNHDHFHFIGNRVKYDGTVVDKDFCKTKGKNFGIKTELKYGLVRVIDRMKTTENTKSVYKEDVRSTIYKAIDKVLNKCESIQELSEYLNLRGIDTEIKTNSGGVYGVKFSTEKGSFKGSDIDKKFGAKKLIDIFENNRILRINKEIAQAKAIAEENRKLEEKAKEEEKVKAEALQKAEKEDKNRGIKFKL
jgi:hypothetical protein